MNEHEILYSTEHYSTTGRIPDGLIPFFGQHGRWIGDKQGWSRSTYATTLDRMRGAVLPASRRTARCRSGLRLLTSFVWAETKPLTLTYCEVSGSIIAPASVPILAPNLRLIGHHFRTSSNQKVTLPSLRMVGGHFQAISTWRLFAPRLKRVDGNLHVYGFNFPSLQAVGGRLWMLWALDVLAPELRVVAGSMHTHVATDLDAPKLRTIGHNFTMSQQTRRVEVPGLETVGGNFSAEGADTIVAPRLRHVGGNLVSPSATRFYRPHVEVPGMMNNPDTLSSGLLDLYQNGVRVGGEWKMHPAAVEHWRKRAARLAMREDHTIEL